MPKNALAQSPARSSPKLEGVVGKFNPKLVGLLVPIEDLREDPENANKHPERSIDDLAESFRAFGQQKPLVHKRGGTVVAGNGGLRAAKRLGWTHVASIPFDGSSEESRAYAIADNRTAESSERDEEVLGRQLRELAATWDDFRPEIVGYTEAEARALPGGYGEEPSPEPAEDEKDEGRGAEGPSESDPDAPEEFAEVTDVGEHLAYRCPKCFFEWSGKAR